MAQADYRRAIELITQHLKQSDLTLERRAKLYWLKAVCHISQDEISQAKSSFLKMLMTNPHFEPGQNISPKILSLYNEIFDSFKQQGGLEQSVKSVFAPLENITSGEPFIFQVRIEDPNSAKKVARLEFHVRKLGNSEFSSLDFKKPKTEVSTYEVSVPPILTARIESDATFEYYVDFLSADGARIGTIGKETFPLTFLVNPKAKESNSTVDTSSKKSFKTAAIWISAAALATAGVVVATLALSTPNEGSLRLKIFAE